MNIIEGMKFLFVSICSFPIRYINFESYTAMYNCILNIICIYKPKSNIVVISQYLVNNLFRMYENLTAPSSETSIRCFAKAVLVSSSSLYTSYN